MPKTKLENVIFTLLMAFVMVYAMICYNIALNVGGMSNQVFAMAFGEMVIMWPVAFILEFFVVERLSQKLAFRLVTPGVDKPVFVILAISCMIVCLMCPMMSLVATILLGILRRPAGAPGVPGAVPPGREGCGQCVIKNKARAVPS